MTIAELLGKVKELEKDNRKLKTDMKKVLSDHAETSKQVQEYCGLNTELRSKVKNYQDMQVANMEILESYENLKKKYKELEEKVKPDEREKHEEEEENIHIEILAQFKQSGSRRSPNSERPIPNQQPSVESTGPCSLFKCDRCVFKSVSEERLKNHYRQNHFNCDLCDITLGTAYALRAHNKNMHKAPGGTAKKCETCDYSAVNEAHLKKHVRRHHKEVKCNKCDFRTVKEYDLAEHIRRYHSSQDIQCKFGVNCRKRLTCRFNHPNTEQRSSPRGGRGSNVNINPNNPWIHPAYVSQSAYNSSFPFLVQAMWQMTRRRGA